MILLGVPIGNLASWGILAAAVGILIAYLRGIAKGKDNASKLEAENASKKDMEEIRDAALRNDVDKLVEIIERRVRERMP